MAHPLNPDPNPHPNPTLIDPRCLVCAPVPVHDIEFAHVLACVVPCCTSCKPTCVLTVPMTAHVICSLMSHMWVVGAGDEDGDGGENRIRYCEVGRGGLQPEAHGQLHTWQGVGHPVHHSSHMHSYCQRMDQTNCEHLL